ncbi:MAG TPA: molybdopterin synthase sulfur carrier subunit [Labilithrix sp.]|nr:molybdopterin synthase sulfur carrier subunit [Labilithrix sp.]
MRVIVPTHLRSYTLGESEVEAQGATLGEVLEDLETRFRGFRFRVVDEQDRIRAHVKFFVGGEETFALETAVGEREVQIVAALSGG